MSPNALLVQEFIDLIWNQQQFDQLPRLLHPDFHDHSLPPALPTTVAGVAAWVRGTSTAFQHHTTIQEQVTQGAQSMLKIQLRLTHIGEWRGIAVTGRTVEVVGYRHFRMAEGQIREHWALLDGNAIENQLTAAGHGCKIQE
ncbi:MAG: ester cyclase [Bacteroidota bacterium]|nr:ester cyclase [Bacteroidota bacterium]